MAHGNGPSAKRTGLSHIKSEELKKAVAVSKEKIQQHSLPQARPILQQPFSLPESAQTLAGIAFRAAGKSGNHFPAASKFAGKPFLQRKFGQPQPS